MGKALEVPYDDYSQWLLCDQAIIAAFGYEDYFPSYVRPYTTATTLSSGWVWDTPLQSRRSIGYVHSSSFTTEEKAKRELPPALIEFQKIIKHVASKTGKGGRPAMQIASKLQKEVKKTNKINQNF